MGDQVRDAVEGELFYAPAAEFERIRRLNAPAERRAEAFADLARLNALFMIARAGSGHIGSSFSSMDIVAWLHLQVLQPGRDLFFSSKGHDVPGLYTVLIALGRLPESGLGALRRLGGLPGHPDVGTPGIVANTGSLGMGISKAKGMVAAARLKGEARRVFVLTGDGELQEGQIWESLGGAARRGLHEITVIVDHNKLQSDSFVARVADLGDLEAKFRAFGWHVARCDGNDIDALSKSLAALDAVQDRPKVLIADTVKGRGVSFMEHTALPEGEEFYRFHSGAPSAADYRRAALELSDRVDARLAGLGAAAAELVKVQVPPAAPAAGEMQRLVPAYTEALLAAAAARPEVVALDADLILDTGLIPFRDRFPDRFFECGIAEQDMVSQASGMALSGLVPVVHSFACFMTQRANEQIYNLCSERRRAVFVGTLAGLVPAGPGHSHQGIRDLSAMGAMPGMTLVEPGSAAEVGPLLEWCLGEAEGPAYMRLVSVPCRVPYAAPAGLRPRPGQGWRIHGPASGAAVVLVGYGPVLLPQAVRAAEALAAEDGIAAAVLNLPWLNRLDAGWLRGELAGARLLVTLDNHLEEGGQGRLIAQRLAEDMPPGLRLRSVALEGLPECGGADEVLAHHGMDAASMQRVIRAALREGQPAR